LSQGGVLDIGFKDKDVERLCSDVKHMTKKLGKPSAKKLRTRLNELWVAANLSEVVSGRPHPLHNEFEGCFGLELAGGMRLVIEPNHSPLPLLDDGGLDRKLITSVCVVFVGDYHD